LAPENLTNYPFLNLVCNEPAEIGVRTRNNDAAQLCEPRPNCGIGQTGFHV